MNPEKDMLNKELVALQKRIAELEREKQLQLEVEIEKEKTEHFLRERVKELNCLYSVSELIDQYGSSIENILQGVVDLLPPSWQHPHITCSRVIFKDVKYVSSNFQITKWRQVAKILISGKKEGIVEVYYLEEMPVIDEGPFLNEERLLINAVAKRISRTIERIRIEQQLEVEHKALEHKNIALREVLERVQEEKEQMGAVIQSNVDKIVMPILFAFESRASKEQFEYVKLLKNSLEEIISPFTSKISKEFARLSSAEIQICNMIKNGFTTKEIARLRGISTATVSRHREHIRKKLGLTNNKINLTSFLNNFMSNN